MTILMIMGLAPMDGITDCAYRTIVQQIFEQYHAPDDTLFMRTEFMSADGYIKNPSRLIKHLMKTDYNKPVYAQIYGGNPDNLLKTALDIEEKYADYFAGIELNIGCPSPKVMACGGGSGMMKDKQQTLDIIKQLSQSLTMPFSIKTRAGITTEDTDAQFDFVCESSKYCHMIIIHGRTYKQSHSGDVDRDFIYRLKQYVGDSCTIIGNGGVTSYHDAQEKCGILDGVMIGQAAIGNPRCLVPYTPTIQERYFWAKKHLDQMIAREWYYEENKSGSSGSEKFGKYHFVMPTTKALAQYMPGSHPALHRPDPYSVIEFRKYLFNYVKGLAGNKDFKTQVATIKEYDLLCQVMKDFFAQCAEQEVAP